MSKRSYRNAPTDHTPFYPRLIGRKGAVASNSYLSANAGADMLRAGGNAIDAACAATLVEGLVNPHMNGIGGECPMLIRTAGSNEVISVNANTEAPMKATVEAYTSRGLKDVPDIGILAAGAPATPSALIAVLQRYGTKSFAEVAAPVIELAKNGHPAQTGLVNQQNYGLRDTRARLRQWPGSWSLYYPGGNVPQVGQLLTNPALARTYEAMAEGERAAAGDRVAKLQGARDVFYKGAIAEEIARFSKEQGGLLEKADLERYQTRFEKPASMKIADTEVFKCGIWSQGPAVIQTLAIMQNWDLKAMGHGSADYCHLLVEAMKLAFADREQFYADPDMTPVPTETLLSAEYGKKRAGLIDMKRASTEHRPGDAFKGGALLDQSQHLLPAPWGRGTVHVDAVDAQGNMASFTPSGAWIPSSPVIPALGFPLGNRLMTFYLSPANHPNLLAPGKRPRTTLTPGLAFKGGKPWMSFGTMGGDQQEQWLIQFFINRAIFGMGVQEAIEAPKLSIEHMPGFFAPHNFFPNRLRVEPRIGKPVLDELAQRGHEVDIGPDWTEGFITAIEWNPDTGLLEAGVDPRGSKAEAFPQWACVW